jgi:Zn-dependent membrane protease YugP
MLLIILGLLLLLLILAPSMWVKYVLKKHHTHLPDMPGTGSELAIHLLQQYQLEQVAVEQTEADNDHYSPADNAVRLSPDVYSGKSLTAIAVAAHEVGHAIQFNHKEPVSLLRSRYLGSVHRIQKIGVMLLISMPFIGSILHLPQVSVLLFVVGLATLFSSALLYAAVLPEEWDASFNKALPILEKGEYVPPVYMPAIRQILTACALTYVAAALADVLRLWRWLRFIR